MRRAPRSVKRTLVNAAAGVALLASGALSLNALAHSSDFGWSKIAEPAHAKTSSSIVADFGWGKAMVVTTPNTVQPSDFGWS